MASLVYSPPMRSAWRSLGGPTGLVLLLAAAIFMRPAIAVAQAPQSQTPKSITLLPRFDASFAWAKLVSSDPRFSWDALMGIDTDVVDYGIGSITFQAEYEGVLSGERREFDLSHSNYMLDGAGSYRLPEVTLLVAFHHVSRHVSDRANPNVPAWNVLDVRGARRFTVGGSTIDARLAAGRVLKTNFVDYVWTSDIRLLFRRPIRGNLSWVALATGQLIGVDPTKLGRDRQCGATMLAGLRVSGRAAALEIVGGYERRIDGYPTDRVRVRAFTFGFRLTSS
jgi:hypothetical protein